MNRFYLAGFKGQEAVKLQAFATEQEAMLVGSQLTGFDCVEVYISPQPFSVFAGKPAKLSTKKRAKKTTQKTK